MSATNNNVPPTVEENTPAGHQMPTQTEGITRQSTATIDENINELLQDVNDSYWLFTAIAHLMPEGINDKETVTKMEESVKFVNQTLKKIESEYQENGCTPELSRCSMSLLSRIALNLKNFKTIEKNCSSKELKEIIERVRDFFKSVCRHTDTLKENMRQVLPVETSGKRKRVFDESSDSDSSLEDDDNQALPLKKKCVRKGKKNQCLVATHNNLVEPSAKEDGEPSDQMTESDVILEEPDFQPEVSLPATDSTTENAQTRDAHEPTEEDNFELTEEEGMEELDDDTRRIWAKIIVDDIGCADFMKGFSRIEAEVFSSKRLMPILCSSGEDFEKKIEEYGHNRVYLLTKTDKRFGLEVPKINFKNLKKFLDINEVRPFISSYTRKTEYRSINNLLEEIAKRDSGHTTIEVLNLLSFEFSGEKKLINYVQLPNFVKKNSIVSRLRSLAESDVKMNKRTKTRLDNVVKGLHDVERFLLITMKDSFTDLHVDLSATAVYYHVICGKKVFYIAEPTEENIALYENYERTKTQPDKWIVNDQQFWKEFQRIEINAGQVAILPPGYLHFVYTPEDSVVIGGNFIKADNLELSFRLTKLEEQCLPLTTTKENEMFSNFWETIYSYVDFLLLPELKKTLDELGEISEDMKKMAVMIHDELADKAHFKNSRSWCKEKTKQRIVNELAKFLMLCERDKDAKQNENNQAENEADEDDSEHEDDEEDVENVGN